jgi:hypothetical protein
MDNFYLLSMDNKSDKKPEVPTGHRLLNAQEKIEPRDVHWVGTKWLEVATIRVGKFVFPNQVGYYCRKQ